MIRGVTLFEIADDVIGAGRLYPGEVERDPIGIDQAVETFVDHRARAAGP